MGIIEDTAFKLQMRPSQVFCVAIMELDDPTLPDPNIMLAQYVECKKVHPKIVDWCLHKLVPRKQEVVLKGGL